ncbi:MAG: DinB family protein [Candidatus Solibacter usitatus]|nr:DinB family protein [Candidatus Solibacter usitatus]
MISSSLLPEFDQELKTTRRVLERIPDDKLDYKPHARSMSARELSSHIAEMISWLTVTMNTTSLDLAPPGQEPWKPFSAASNAQLLQKFDDNVTAARAALAASSDADMMVSWSLMRAGATLMTMPRVACVRGFVFNHIIHHRGQLSVYLRLNDIPVPSIYGPSADEGKM